MATGNNIRIAKNSLFLYLRMLIVMGVSLFTVRVVLNVLGTEDFGIHNVVAGVVTMLSFLTSTMTSATQRFFAYALGLEDEKKVTEYFTTSFWCYVLMAFIILFLAETVGLWFVYSYLNIPSSRFTAALWVYQFSIFSFLFSVLSIPYNSLIVAREKMNIYAYLGLIEVFFKLGLVYLLQILDFDKLIAYAVLLLLTAVSICSFYVIYCNSKFKECKIQGFGNKSIFFEILKYSGWSLFGAVSGIFRSQGINILLNIFFNPMVNAARAIAFQVNNAINQFVLNFFKAVQPQITKYYASDDSIELNKLIIRSSRYCTYLILAIALPLLFEMPYVLNLWLVDVPEYAVLFTRLVVINAIIDSMAYPLQSAISATGNIKWFQIVTGGLLNLNLPISLLFLWYGFPPEVTMYVSIAISIISQILRVLFTNYQIGINIPIYIEKVLLRIVLVLMFSLILIVLFKQLATSVYPILSMVFCFSIVCVVTFSVGIPSVERKKIINLISSKF